MTELIPIDKLFVLLSSSERFGYRTSLVAFSFADPSKLVRFGIFEMSTCSISFDPTHKFFSRLARACLRWVEKLAQAFWALEILQA